MSRYREFITASLILGASVVQCAVNPDGARVVVPVGDDEASPFADIKTYDPDQNDCPLPCAHLDIVHTWVTYLSADRLRRCQQPTPLQLSPTQRPSGGMLIRVCTFGGAGGGEPIITSNTNLTYTITEASKVAN
ncbi:hypothetical protein CGLO_07250 [Colletotrichum gloeosporioides Cg-14]|uniref:Uncharacterized protein n=1 Tax=Colletotrichum gloeosporioides (strain Cg-14) TaxID=1237896 RepID=T0KM83_COLGC|nr:hypothetical protein CGLO_07250 [Colletotrichum gloeosporioides Cg-14]